MQRRIALASILALTVLVLASVPIALADGGTGVTVNPLQPKPGDVITVKGDRLGANVEVEVRVLGPGGVNIDLGEVRAGAEGDFTAEFRLPADLAVGTYQVQARGAESATTQITVRGGGGGTTDEEMEMAGEPVLRSRPLGEAAALVALFGVLAGLGILFARRGTTQAA